MDLPIIALYERDLKKLSEEISHFRNPANLWVVKPGITNSAGNLVLHLTGNLNYLIGATLGNTGFVRDRDREFSEKGLSAESLIEETQKVIPVVRRSIELLTAEDLQKEFPIAIGGKVYSTETMLIFLLAHFNYHLGQINYLRRILEGENS